MDLVNYMDSNTKQDKTGDDCWNEPLSHEALRMIGFKKLITIDRTTILQYKTILRIKTSYILGVLRNIQIKNRLIV